MTNSEMKKDFEEKLSKIVGADCFVMQMDKKFTGTETEIYVTFQIPLPAHKAEELARLFNAEVVRQTSINCTMTVLGS